MQDVTVAHLNCGRCGNTLCGDDKIIINRADQDGEPTFVCSECKNYELWVFGLNRIWDLNPGAQGIWEMFSYSGHQALPGKGWEFEAAFKRAVDKLTVTDKINELIRYGYLVITQIHHLVYLDTSTEQVLHIYSQRPEDK